VLKFNGLLHPEVTEYKISDIVAEAIDDTFGHGGGDYMMLQDLYKVLEGDIKAETTLEKSVGAKGVMVAPVDVFNAYYFSSSKTSESIIYEWLNTTIVSSERIKYITDINVNYYCYCLI
jgi:hypothetical protein